MIKYPKFQIKQLIIIYKLNPDRKISLIAVLIFILCIPINIKLQKCIIKMNETLFFN